ncbi:hypothetical protein AgCh_003399 [Apium graveolens]
MKVTIDNSGERAAPSDGVPGPSMRGWGVAAGWAPAKQHRKGGLAPTAPPGFDFDPGWSVGSGFGGGLWYMVRIKERARKVYNCYPNFSGEESDPDSSGREQIRVVMAKKAFVSAEIISKFRYKKTPGGSVPFTPEGYWIDVKYHFVEKPTEIENEVYYSRVRYDRQPDGHPGVYNQEALERMFAAFPISRDHYKLKDSFSEADPGEMNEAVRAAFQLTPDIEWRWPEPHERIYHRPEDGFVPVWMEHLRSGWSPRCHMFIKHLCKHVYRISPMQITPNGIKSMTWFVACCNKSGFLPTLKLFHQIFYLSKSSQKPFYEIRFRASECGYGPGRAKPIMHQSSLKYWNGEIILLKGYDLAYLPYFTTEGVQTKFNPAVLEGRAVTQIRCFCESLEFQPTRDTFMNHKLLFNLGCLPHLNRNFLKIMSSSAYAATFNTLGLAFKTSKGVPGPGSGSADIEGGAESSVPQNIPDLGHESEPKVQEISGGDGPSSKKRKSVLNKPPRGKTVVFNRVICDSEGRGPDGEAVKIGTKTLINLAGFMSSIPSEEDWKEVEGYNMTAALKRVTGGPGGVPCGGDRVNEKLKDSETRAEGLAKEVERLKAELAAKENLNKEAIIAEFKASDVYDFEVAQAGVPEVRRSWVVAERHIKTDPLASWESFIQEFLAVKAAVEQGQGEPEPYDGPSPSFL